MSVTLTSKQRELWIAVSRLSAQNIAPLMLQSGDPEWLEEAFFRKDPELTGLLTESEWNQMVRTHDPAGLNAILCRMNREGIDTLTVCDPDFRSASDSFLPGKSFRSEQKNHGHDWEPESILLRPAHCGNNGGRVIQSRSSHCQRAGLRN